MILAGLPQFALATSPEFRPEPPISRSAYSEAKKVIDSRCTICHSCYRAPCQFQTGSLEGILRGASKEDLNIPSLAFKTPARLLIDGNSEADWRKLGFFPVLGSGEEAIAPFLVELKKSGYKGEVRPYGSEYRCSSTLSDLKARIADQELDAMPYGFPPLPQSEYQKLSAFFSSPHASEPRTSPLSDREKTVLSSWYKFFNRVTLKHRLVSRYLYEKLFVATLRIEGIPGRNFRLVRSLTPAPEKIAIVTTISPADSPGGPNVYYRLIEDPFIVMRKNHVDFSLDSGFAQEVDELFLRPKWPEEDKLQLPPYNDGRLANPFRTFRQIPIKPRVRFALNHPYFLLDGFFRTPACFSENSTEILKDHFWITLVKPESDPALSKEYLSKLEGELDEIWQKPYDGRSLHEFTELFNRFSKSHAEAVASIRPSGFLLSDIFDGKDSRDGAFFTVETHGDSTTALRGLQGGMPTTAWLMDYAVGEMIWYSGVVNFSIYQPNVPHMQNMRALLDGCVRDAEGLFLSMLQGESRSHYSAEWAYRTHNRYIYRRPFYFNQLAANPGGPKSLMEVFSQLFSVHPSLELATTLAPWANELQKAIAENPKLPQLVRDDQLIVLRDGEKLVSVLSLVRNRHKGAYVLFGTPIMNRVDGNLDRISIMSGAIGGMPNDIFVVAQRDLESFAAGLKGASSSSDYESLKERFTIRRSDPRIWPLLDGIHTWLKQNESVFRGMLDVSKYQINLD